MAGLLSRQQTGKGVWIDCNLFESQVCLVANVVEFIVDGSFIDCGLGEYRVKLFDRWTRGLEAWHSSSIHSSVSGLSLQERTPYDWGRE